MLTGNIMLDVEFEDFEEGGKKQQSDIQATSSKGS
jgi:hypothetical protein